MQEIFYQHFIFNQSKNSKSNQNQVRYQTQDGNWCYFNYLDKDFNSQEAMKPNEERIKKNCKCEDSQLLLKHFLKKLLLV